MVLIFFYEHSDHKIVCTIWCNTYIYLQESENESIRSIWNQKVKPQGKDAFTNPDVGMERVRNEFHAFLVNHSIGSLMQYNLNHDFTGGNYVGVSHHSQNMARA